MNSYYPSYEQFNWTTEYKHVIRITAEINWYSRHDKVLICKLRQQIMKLSFIKAYSKSYKQFNWTTEYKHVIKTTAEINRYSWHNEALVYKLWQQIINLSFIKHLVRVVNKNYYRSVKEILSEPTRRNPHTKVSSRLHLSPATGGIKP